MVFIANSSLVFGRILEKFEFLESICCQSMTSLSENQPKNDIDSNQSTLDDQPTESDKNDSTLTTTTTVIEQ